jgi:CheY-like chemotaxis protein
MSAGRKGCYEEPVNVSSNRTILLVDDDDDFRLSFAELLRLEGRRVIEAPTGEAALVELERMRRRHEAGPDLIVLDLMMPRVSGLELLQRLRRAPRWAAVPVLVVTAVNDPMLPVRLDLPTAFKTGTDALLSAVRQQLDAPLPSATETNPVVAEV